MTDLINRMSDLVKGWHFGALVLLSILFFDIAISSILLIPSGESALAAFAEEFRQWCFNYDPVSGDGSWGYVSAFYFQSFLLIGIVSAFWWRDILEGVNRIWWRLVPHCVTAACLVGLGLLGFASMFEDPNQPTGLAFPAEALRTHDALPVFSLVNQKGEMVTNDTFEGKILVVSSFYAACAGTCPTILRRLGEIVENVPEELKPELRVLGVSMNPEHDSPEVLQAVADVYNLQHPVFHLTTGVGSHVEALLDQLKVSRKKDETTGVIDHNNVFILVDRDGEMAYSFSLGEQSQKWLPEALLLLLDNRKSELIAVNQ